MESDSQPIFNYEMHPLIQRAYQCVHDWFDDDKDFKDFRALSYADAQRVLQRKTLVDAAFNFNYYFPTHYFKVCHTLQSEKIIGLDRLGAWLRYNPYLTVVDVGCGDGAGSTAVVSALLKLREDGQIDERRIQLHCIGLDPNRKGLAIYRRMVGEIAQTVKALGIDVHYTPIASPISQASAMVENRLFDIRHNLWNQPSLSHTILILSNLTDILYEEYLTETAKAQEYERFDLSSQESFGEQISSFSRTIFEAVPIDHLHILSIDTEPQKVRTAISEMVDSIEIRMQDKGHTFEKANVQLEKINIKNPPPSYWQRVRKDPNGYPLKPFLVFTGHIHNKDLALDDRWIKIISQENLELAWARVRQEMLRESFSDEIEIRLFEQNLNENLKRLHIELENYAFHFGYVNQILTYGYPKSPDRDRPRGLTWLEEEILMIAVIQVIGISTLRDKQWSYAYRLSPENSPERGQTEYLYEHWSSAWKLYRSEVEEYAQKFPVGLVFRTDIKSYYTRILQDRLHSLLKSELQISKRIEWLLELLVTKEVKGLEAGRGLVQGSIGSGFLANLYLSGLDNLFPPNDVKKRRLFRYMDDIVVVIPNPVDQQSTGSVITQMIDDLKLEPNPDKTETLSVKDFLASSGVDEILDELFERYEEVLDPFWWMNDETRNSFKNNSSNDQIWWRKITDYRTCLTEAGLFLNESWLSREISKKLIIDVSSKISINFPDLPSVTTISSAIEWVNQLQLDNPDWWSQVDALRNDLKALFVENFIFYSNKTEKTAKHDLEKSGRRLRFAANRIGILGFGDIHEDLTSLLSTDSWQLRYQSPLLDDLARQGYTEDIWKVFDHHNNGEREMSQYMSAIAIRALRFVPRFEPEGWARIIDCMFCDKELIRLMATETWLFLTAKMKSSPHAERIMAGLQQVFTDGNLPSRRLLKNFLLVFGKIDQAGLEKLGKDRFRSDPMLSQAFDLATSGVQPGFLLTIEPEVIRQKYYSTKYHHFDDLGERS